MKTKLPLSILFIFLFSGIVKAQTLYDVVLGTDNVPVTEVQFEFNGTTITQTNGYGTSSTPVANRTTLPVLMNYIKIDVGGGTIKTLDFFNALGSFVTNNNFTTAATGVGVYNEGVKTEVKDGVAAWENAMQDMVNSRNALHYLYYDGVSNIPPANDFDLLFKKALTDDDHLVVSERFGNTFFTVTPLDVNGNPIASARKLRFGFQNGPNNGGGSTTGNGSLKYDWNIGFGSDGQNASQPQYFSVVDVELFNSTSDIYGFRIDNNGEADVKFYGISDDTFTDNPTNPIVPGITGNVFNDLDQLDDNTVDGNGISTPSGTQLYVSLVDASNNIISTIPVENDGSFEFLENVDKNTDYTIVLHTTSTGSTTPNLPINWSNTGENQGINAGNDGNVNGVVAVSVGTVIETEVNFGIIQVGSIGDTVWYDEDGDGTQNGSENGLEGATVTLDPGTPSDPSDDVITTTDANGNYLFDNLSAGDYTVSVDVSTVTGGLPAGVTSAELSQTYDDDGTGSANTSNITLIEGEDNLDQDFGYSALVCVISNPTTPALDFNIFTENGLFLKTNETEGSIATGGDLTILGSYQAAIHNAGTFQVNNTNIGLLVDGKVIYQSGSSLQVGSSAYVKIGNQNNSVVWYTDQNNATPPIRVTANSNYNSNPFIQLQQNSTFFNVSATNNLVFENNLIDFANAFQTLESNSTTISQNTNNAQLTNPNGNSISNTNLPNQVKINLQNGINYLNVTGTDLNNVSVFTYNNQPSSSKILIINVDAPGTFNWNVWNQAGVAIQNAPYILYNFYNTTQLNINGNSTIEGTVFAPFADIDKTVNQSNIEGQVIGKTFKHAGGEVHSANFNADINICSSTTATGSIGDTVWYDTDEDGTINGTENGLEDATVTLDPGTPGDASDDVTTTTDVNGEYLFDNLPAGDYTVTVDVSTVTGGLPTGVTIADLVQTYDNDGTGSANTSNVTLGSGENNLDQDFGYYATGSIGDTVWYDTDGDGTINGTENGLEGATITLDPGTPGDASDDVTTTTDANGNYLFDDLPAGDYTVTVDVSTVTGGLPTGITIADLVQTYDNDGTGSANTSNVTLGSGENNLDQDFGYVGDNGLGSIGDTVWYDTDGDGIKDAGEAGLGGATVTLDPGTPSDPSDDVTTTTDANGEYLFDNLPAGTYTISVDVSTVTSGIPAGETAADLVQTYDWDSVGTPNNSTINLASGEDNLDQDFAYVVPTGGTSGGNSGGVESESLGDAISKIYVGRKKNSVPTQFVKSTENVYNKAKLKSKQPYQGKGQTMLDMFPAQLYAGNVANVTSPTDILDYTIADEVLSVDFSLDGETKGVVLGIKTSDKIYNHTKASCDRLRGAEILNIQKIEIQGYNFLMQGIKQRSGEIEYAISFATAKNNNDANYTIQTNWYVNDYTKFNDVYNFQVWSTRPADTQKLVADILNNLKSYIPVAQTEVQKFPETYASKIYRDKGELVVALRSTKEGNTADISMVELYSETANNIKHRYNTVSTEIQQSLRLDIADGYEYDALIKVDNEVEDAFYHADGNWGLDYDARYTEIKNYFVWNDFDREYQDDEYTINRSIELQATSDYDYLTVYKSLLPGTLSADYSEYNYVAFTAKGSGLMEIGLLKSSIEDWTAQYRVMVDFSEEEQTYYVPFDAFTSSATQEKLTAEDLTTLTFTFLPVEANTTELDLEISDVKFTKVAVEDQIIEKIETFENEFMAYPNPSKGNVNLLLFSETDTEATVTLTDVTGKVIYQGKTQLNAGKNELEYNFKVKTGVMLLQVTSPETDYGTSKIIFR